MKTSSTFFRQFSFLQLHFNTGISCHSYLLWKITHAETTMKSQAFFYPSQWKSVYIRALMHIQTVHAHIGRNGCLTPSSGLDGPGPGSELFFSTMWYIRNDFLLPAKILQLKNYFHICYCFFKYAGDSFFPDQEPINPRYRLFSTLF